MQSSESSTDAARGPASPSTRPLADPLPPHIHESSETRRPSVLRDGTVDPGSERKPVHRQRTIIPLVAQPAARAKPAAPEYAGVALEADGFLRSLVRNIFGAIDELVGPGEAAAFASLIGRQIGKEMDTAYRRALNLPALSREQLAAVLVDLKRRIDGDFYVVSQNDEEIVMASRRCPFGAQVVGRPELCTMTSTMFGAIASDNLGYARVAVERAIARGDAECRVVIRLRPPGAADRRRSPDDAPRER